MTSNHDLPSDPSATDPRANQFSAAIRAYPKRWRRIHEAGLLGMLLDDADRRGLDSVPRQDLARLVVAGLRERIFSYDRMPLASRVWLLTGVAFALYYVVVATWSPGVHAPGSLGPFSNPAVLSASLLTVSAACALFHRGRTARAAAWCSVASSVVLMVAAMHWTWLGPSPWASALVAVPTTFGALPPKCRRV